MTYIEFHILTTSQHEQVLSEQLARLGAVAVTGQDAGNQPIYEPGPGEYRPWPEMRLIALFNEPALQTMIEIYLHEQQKSGLITDFHSQAVAEQDWVRQCLDQFSPMQFGKRLWICPSWTTPPDPNAVNVILDPGFAFGTGTHETTALCLAWLDEHMGGGETVIDYGCGSGILGLAALKLGAKQVIAVDHDPQALDAIKMNAEQNHVPSEQLKTCYPAELNTPPVDLLIANILAQPLIELAPHFANLVKPGGQLVLSGILTTQANNVMQAYSPWFTFHEPNVRSEWVGLDGIKIISTN